MYHAGAVFEVVANCIEVVGVDVEFVVLHPGALAVDEHGRPLPRRGLALPVRPVLGEMQRRVVGVAHAHQQHRGIEVVETTERRLVAQATAERV